MKLRNLWLAILALLGCNPKFVDTTVSGVPNMVEYAPGMWRMGQPTDLNAWSYVLSRVSKPNTPVLVIKLNDDKEGDDSPVANFKDWHLAKTPLPPEDDKPWTVFVKPDPGEVTSIVKLMRAAHEAGWVVIHHCTHGRDRTSLIAALYGMQELGWSKQTAWNDMIAHGFRWELPDLDTFWIEDVPSKKFPGAD